MLLLNSQENSLQRIEIPYKSNEICRDYARILLFSLIMSLQINFRAGLITDMLKRTNIILSILCLAVSIQQVCENDDQCPSNSICNLRLQTCKCISGFIGQCNISALALTNNTITVEMNSSNIQYFSISPLEVNQFLDIRINICQINSQDKLQAYFWGETGH
jgi:hypothetical protein